MIVIKKTIHDEIMKSLYLQRTGYPGHYKYKYAPDGLSSGHVDDSEELKQLKTDCFDYAKKYFSGRKFTNKHTGYEIEVSKRGLNEWVSKSKSEEQILSIKRLDEILENAKYTHSSANVHNPKDKSVFDYYEYDIEINSKPFNVIVTIKSIDEGKGDKLKTRKIYHHHYLDDIKIKPVSSATRVVKATTELLLTGSNKNISENYGFVKKSFSEHISEILNGRVS
ncbi:hypothetical protein [Treponema sp.]|uniref:LPD3 domain-containing protein n=1 Tax=Treponema sp. TaxID=166 RepID=UPI00298E2051|nr:hypothetical protein [Treponema sp.]MCQ2242463.1 hypothetical protein [Treponema sp.]